jgi:hypothetical protein
LAAGAGLFGLIIAAHANEKKDELYKQRFVLSVTNPKGSLLDPSACIVGLTASLLDGTTREPLHESVQVRGLTQVPVDLTGRSLASLPAAEKATASTAPAGAGPAKQVCARREAQRPVFLEKHLPVGARWGRGLVAHVYDLRAGPVGVVRNNVYIKSGSRRLWRVAIRASPVAKRASDLQFAPRPDAAQRG